MRKLMICILLLLLSLPTLAQDEFAEYFGFFEGTFVIYDINRDMMQVYNPQRAAERFAPFSTYKVFHTAIALETGTADSADFVIEYDSSRYPYDSSLSLFYTPEQYTADHTLRSAVELSIVWYFREMAALIGEEDMQTYVTQFEYGNQDISAWLGDSSGSAPFWLGGSLEISAIEQVLVLNNLYQGNLGLSDSTTETTLDIITLYETEDYRLYGKTGTRAGDLALAWFIGIIEQGEERYVFAFNVEANPAVRSQVLRAILVGEGYMPERSPLFQ